MKLAMAAFGSSEAPSLFLQPLDDIADLHLAGIVACVRMPFGVVLRRARAVFRYQRLTGLELVLAAEGDHLDIVWVTAAEATSPRRSARNCRRGLVGNGRSHPGHELRCVALYHLPDARPKLVVKVETRIAAHRRTKIVDCRRSGSRPIGAVSRGDCDRSQRPEKIRSVQPALAGVVTGDKNARSCVGGPAHKAAAGRRSITHVVLER